MQIEHKLTLGYWNLRGRAQNLRLLFSYLNLDFKEQTYNSHNDWYKGPRQTLGLDFINLPYLIDKLPNEDFKVTQTNGIARYVITCYGQNHLDLLGKNLKDAGIIDSIIGLLDDNLTPINNLLYQQTSQEQKQQLFDKKIRWRLDSVVKYLDGKDWLLGYLTWADFKFAEFLNYIQQIYSTQYSFIYQQSLNPYRQRFQNLPGIKNYYNRPDAVKQLKGPWFPFPVRQNMN